MNRILLVDEPTAVRELLGIVKPLQNDYEIKCCTSRTEAELFLASNRVEVVVSEARLPDSDGTELLRSVRDLYPDAVRIIRTRKMGRSELQRVLMIAHRYLPKPCEGNLCLSTIYSSLALRERLRSHSLQELASKLFSVPSIPGVYQRVMTEIEKPDPNMDRIAEIISTDPGITAKVIQMVNSPVVGLRYPVTSIVQAIITLGLEMTKILVLTANLFSKLRSTTGARFNYDAIWSRSQKAAALARTIARSEGADDRTMNDAAVSGLLHLIGHLVLIYQMPDLYAQMQMRIDKAHMKDFEAERQTFGATIAELSAYLLGLWGLPNTIVEAIAWYQEPQFCPMKSFTPLTALHVATSILAEKEAEEKRKPQEHLDHEYINALGMNHRIESWYALSVMSTKPEMATC